MAPTVTVLTTTYNRPDLLPRSMRSVLSQDYQDLELIVIDDCSTDNTPEVVKSFTDPRIRYIRNEANEASVHGDRIIARRTVYELMRGKYFCYLCDDDFWLPKDLLSRQIAAFEKYPSLAMVIGGQATMHHVPLTKQPEDATWHFEPVPEVSPTTYHMHGLFPAGFIPRRDFLKIYADDPITRNILDGATLFSRDAFIKGGVFKTLEGSRWQAGYELKIGPALMGDVFYIDEPCVIATIGATNASFRGTQKTHYLDSVKTVEVAVQNAMPVLSPPDQAFAIQVKKNIIHQITVLFFLNKISYRLGWQKGASVNIEPLLRDPLTLALARQTFRANDIAWTRSSRFTAALSVMPGWLLKAGIGTLRGFDRLMKNVLPVRRNMHLAMKRAPLEFSETKKS